MSEKLRKFSLTLKHLEIISYFESEESFDQDVNIENVCYLSLVLSQLSHEWLCSILSAEEIDDVLREKVSTKLKKLFSKVNYNFKNRILLAVLLSNSNKIILLPDHYLFKKKKERHSFYSLLAKTAKDKGLLLKLKNFRLNPKRVESRCTSYIFEEIK